MPAKIYSRVAEENTYSHIYNKGVGDLNIFKDKEDEETFVSYLKGYLSPPTSVENTKKTFTVNGKSFQGVPHQPKNFFGKVELVAYKITPFGFDLLLHQIDKNSIQGLIRSLGTRYSIYFNKKYQRTGTLFQGPYKSVHVKSEPELQSLKNELESKKAEFVPKKDIAADLFVEEKSGPGFFGYSIAVVFFFVLLGLGISHIQAYDAQNTQNTAVLSESTVATPVPAPLDTPTPEPEIQKEPAVMVTVKITDGSPTVNIRQQPTIYSDSIGKATDGDTFELVSTMSGFYEVKLKDGTTGFISAKYIQKGGSNQ